VNLTTPEIVLIAVAAVAVLLIAAAVVLFLRRRRRREQLKERFGDKEYARTVDRAGSEKRAEDQLAERQARRERFEIRSLSSGERQNFRGRFEAVEASFVDNPEGAVRAADALLDAVAERRGYPEVPADERLDDLTTDHPAAVDRYRSTRAAADRDGSSATTEQHRQAMLGSRTLFESLVGRDVDGDVEAPRSFRDIIPEDQGEPVGSNGDGRGVTERR
jgi:hypothetical protein